MDDTRPVVIVGAGLAGLSLARILYVNGIRSVVLEAEPDRFARRQGGMLDIHDEGGQRALRAGQLDEQFQSLILPGAEARRLLDKFGAVWFESEGPGGRPEVERGQLRDMLIDSLPDGIIRWGARVMSVSLGADDIPSITLADGATLEAGLLVGADGTWSRVRPLLSSTTPDYTGVMSVDAYLYDSDVRHPAAAEAVGRGNMWALGHERSIMGHREAAGRLHFYAWMCVPERWVDTVDLADKLVAKRTLLAEYEGWSPVLRGLLADAESDLMVRPLYQMPKGHRWVPRATVTLIGDAAHVMGPTGDGANLAMMDAADLAVALLAHRDDPSAALHEFESAMLNRADQLIDETDQRMDVLMRDVAAPLGCAALLAEIEGQPAPLQPLHSN